MLNRILYFLFAKRLDTLIIRQFFGPFIVTFSVVTFVLLIQTIMKYIEDFAGKGLGADVYAELFFYLSLNVMPRALPLAVLLSALMTFGNLGEHNELVAIKSSGISLLRVQLPVFVLVIFIAIGAHFFHNRVVPYANIKAYSLLYDIKHKKPAFDLKEGTFYNGISGYSIKVGKKEKDGQSIKDVMIYDHTQGRGNTDLVVADSGRMYMIHNEAYLVIELFNGIRHSEQQQKKQVQSDEYVRSVFDRSKVVFDLSSFKLGHTPEKLFSRNRLMKNASQLKEDVDSLHHLEAKQDSGFAEKVRRYYRFPMVVSDTMKSTDTLAIQPKSELNEEQKAQSINSAYRQALEIKKMTDNLAETQLRWRKEAATFAVEMIHKFSEPTACLIMFLIGAPIGAILRKGGLAIPALITILFFIFFYVTSILGEKIARADMMNVYLGTWASNLILLPIGLFLMYQSMRDANLFEFDVKALITNRLFKKSKINDVDK